MPNIGNLKNVLEKLRSMHSHVTVSANLDGEMTYSVESGHSKTQVFYEKLVNPELGSLMFFPFESVNQSRSQ
jgi:hypothetical protein